MSQISSVEKYNVFLLLFCSTLVHTATLGVRRLGFFSSIKKEQGSRLENFTRASIGVSSKRVKCQFLSELSL